MAMRSRLRSTKRPTVMGGLALRNVFEECAHPCMRRHPIVLSPKLGGTSGIVTSSHRREWASIKMRTSPCGGPRVRISLPPAVSQQRTVSAAGQRAPSDGEHQANRPEVGAGAPVPPRPTFAQRKSGQICKSSPTRWCIAWCSTASAEWESSSPASPMSNASTRSAR